MENKYLLTLLYGVMALFAAQAQMSKPVETDAEFEKNYAWRIRQEKLNGVYIPRDLLNCFDELNRLIEPKAKQKFMSMSEYDAYHKLYFSLGRWIIQNWGFYEGSRLSDYFRKMGISYPEDMAQIIITSYHRHLNKVPLEVKAQVEALKEKRRQEHEARMKKATIISQERRKVERN